MTPFRWQNGNPYLRENTINTAVRSLIPATANCSETGACLTFCHVDKDRSIGTSIKSTVACFNTPLAVLCGVLHRNPRRHVWKGLCWQPPLLPSITNR
ncbi:MAG: hypothetical protein ACLR6J_13005 [Parabacteroides merdae]